MEEAAIWESQYLMPVTWISMERESIAIIKFLKNYVIQSIKDFANNNPGRWINLNLADNSLGNDLEFLEICYRLL